ncbi:MAG TPA: hypothetical protein ENH82_11810 [bacterium]|nr:hypothetical protein [bacterium]
MTYYKAIEEAREAATREGNKINYVVFEYLPKHWWSRSKYGYTPAFHFTQFITSAVVRLTITPNGTITQ